ncbi:MAG: hypothetical protein V3V67_10770 [Myxococcota bacterium]
MSTVILGHRLDHALEDLAELRGGRDADRDPVSDNGPSLRSEPLVGDPETPQSPLRSHERPLQTRARGRTTTD